MSTNFYIRPRPHGARAVLARLIAGRSWPSGGEGIHLGKRHEDGSFSFRAYPHDDAPVTDFASWKRLLALGDVFDEYGREVSRRDMLRIATLRPWGRGPAVPGRDYLDAGGHRFIP